MLPENYNCLAGNKGPAEILATEATWVDLSLPLGCSTSRVCWPGLFGVMIDCSHLAGFRGMQDVPAC